MRCFIAIDLPKEAKEYLSGIQGQLPKGHDEARLLDVEPNILHMTVKFLGEVEDRKVEKLKEVMKNVSFRKFRARIGEIGVFSEDFVRIVWVSLEPRGDFKKIHDVLDKMLYLEGFKMDRGFEPHVTLSRVKWLKNKKDFIEKIRGIGLNHLEFEVDSIKLKRSTLTERGPVYEDIAVTYLD